MKIKTQHGFSLIEMVLAITLLSFFGLGIMTFAVPVTNLWSFQKFQESTANEARLGVMRIVREIGQIMDDASVSAAEAGTITFTTSDGDTIIFGLNGTTATRDEGNGAQTLAENISTLQFVYYDNDGNALASPTTGTSTNIRRVQVIMQASADGKQKTYRVMVYPRNL